MGIFFRKVEKKKSSKLLSIIKKLIIAAMILFLILCVVNGFDIFFIRLVLILLGVLSFIEGTESYFHREEKKIYLTELGTGVFYFIVFGVTW